MYKISTLDSSIDLIDSSSVIEFVKELLEKDKHKDVFLKIESKEFDIRIWCLHENNQLVLLFVPVDSIYDRQISCCNDTSKIEMPSSNLRIGDNGVTCSEYNMLDISTGLNAINNALSTVDLEMLGRGWYAY